MSTLPNTSPAVIHLRAAIAYAETRNKGDAPFALIPYADAIAAGVPFAETLVHEGKDWAVFVMGDVTPWDLIALEQAGVVDDADDARQEITAGFDYPRHVEELEAGIPAAVAALENAFSLPSTCAAETFEQTLETFATKVTRDGNGESLRQLVATLSALLPAPIDPLAPCVSYLREYIRHEDANGSCNFGDCMDWDMGELTETLRGYFESFVVDARDADAPLDSIPNYEDRANAFAVLERASHFSRDAYAGEFMRLAPYVLRNIHPEDVA